jgi:Flp pilus assembly pilin Flp
MQLDVFMVLRLLKKLVRDERGVSAVEYALIAAIVTVATTFAVSAAGFNITDFLPG